jgi:Zn-finger nucleic acid-binding protein
MERVAVGQAYLLECRDCDGVWLDAAEFERVCADGEAQAAVIHRWSAVAPVAVGAPIRYRPCVRCGKLMNRVNFRRMSGTIVDVCRGHGTFLDAGELHAIVTFIQQGGVERAREQEIDALRDARAAQFRRHAADTPVSVGWDETAVHEVMKAVLGRF